MSIIDSRRLQRLWEDAQRKPEWATTRLWEYIFKEKVFRGEPWSIASQQPPTDEDGDLRRVDLVPEYSDDSGAWTRVLFFEAKRANASRKDLETVEFQAFTACCAYLHYFQRNSVWAVTAFGGKARLWAFKTSHDYLTPWIPRHDGIGAHDEYIEAHSSDGQLILNGLKYMRDHREPGDEVFDVASSPRPGNVTLPAGWHDTEVALVAGPSFSTRAQVMLPSSSTSTQGYYTPSQQSTSAYTYTQNIHAPQGSSQGMQRNYGTASYTNQPTAALDAAFCIQVTLIEVYYRQGRKYYRFSIPPQENMEVAAEDWTSHTISSGGQIWPCYAYLDRQSWIQYYTLDLDV